MTTITEKEVSQLRNHAKIGIKISKKVKEQKEQIEKLEEENKKLQEHLDKAREVSNKLIGENNTTMPSQSCLYRENKKLNDEIKELNKKKSIKWSREYAMPLITKLKEELKLKDEIIKLHKTS